MIRLWDRLREWAREEADSASIYVRLANAATRYREKEAALWRDPDLQLALDWQKREAPNQACAARYDPNFAAAIAFLKVSRRRKVSRRQRGAIRGLIFATVAALSVLVVLAAVFAWRSKRELAQTQVVQSRFLAAAFPYTVRSGDTPAGIASLFGVPVAELLRLNHLHQNSELMIGDTLRVPNPFLARERKLSSELDRVTADKLAAEERAQKSEQAISGLRAHVQDLTISNKQYGHDLHVLPWWRAAALLAAGAAALMLGIMLVAVIQWIIARSRFRAVAEMNESLRRLDYKYKASLAKAELRFQELYGRRRHSFSDGQEQSKTPEEMEIEQ